MGPARGAVAEHEIVRLNGHSQCRHSSHSPQGSTISTGLYGSGNIELECGMKVVYRCLSNEISILVGNMCTKIYNWASGGAWDKMFKPSEVVLQDRQLRLQRTTSDEAVKLKRATIFP